MRFLGSSEYQRIVILKSCNPKFEVTCMVFKISDYPNCGTGKAGTHFGNQLLVSIWILTTVSVQSAFMKCAMNHLMGEGGVVVFCAIKIILRGLVNDILCRIIAGASTTARSVPVDN